MTTQPSGTNIWSFLEAIARRRGLIVTIVLLSSVVAAGIALILPKWYAASALMLPTPEESANATLAELTQTMLYRGESYVPGTITANDVNARMLKSRRIAERLIARFNLMDRFNTTNYTATYQALHKRTQIRLTEEGLLEVRYEDRDPQAAAEIATGFVEELIELNRDLRSSSARERREFIEARLSDVRKKLDSARQQLQDFETSNRTVSFDEQTRLVINQAVSLKVKKANLELEIEMGEKTMGKENPALVDTRNRLGIINRQLEQLEEGNNDSSYFAFPISEVPRLRNQYSMLLSQVQVNQSLYQSLLELLQQAHIMEEEQSPTIAVLDWPAVPDLRSRPQRTLIVLFTFVGSFLFAVFLALVLEYVGRLRNQNVEDYNRLVYVAGAFFGWLPGVKKRPDTNRPEN